MKQEKKIKLSVLDQSIVRRGGTAEAAINETIQTAKRADQLGYTVSGFLNTIIQKCLPDHHLKS